MIEWGIKKLNITKNRLPNAGGLIIAPNIKVEYSKNFGKTYK